jgi:hypothetical protein
MRVVQPARQPTAEEPGIAEARTSMTRRALGAMLGLIVAPWLGDMPRAVVTPRTTLVAGVADATTGAAIAGAEVILPNLGLGARTNPLGEARISEIQSGRHLVRVRRLGYAPAELHLQLEGETAGAVFRLERVAVPLDAVKINERWVPTRLKDMEIRRSQGIGRFLVDEQIDSIGIQTLPLAVTTRFPGLKAYSDMSNHWHIASARDHLSVTAGVGVNACDVQVYLDDVALTVGDLDALRTSDFAAIEYYDGLQVPVRYRTKRYGCGVMLLWSRWR